MTVKIEGKCFLFFPVPFPNCTQKSHMLSTIEEGFSPFKYVVFLPDSIFYLAY